MLFFGSGVLIHSLRGKNRIKRTTLTRGWASCVGISFVIGVYLVGMEAFFRENYRLL